MPLQRKVHASPADDTTLLAVTLDDRLFAQLKNRAAQSGNSLGEEQGQQGILIEMMVLREIGRDTG